jgi:hypothetical protein
MSTRLQIANKIRENLNDQGYFYTADDLNDSLQDGYDEVAAESGCIEKGSVVDFVPNTVYYDLRALIPGFLSLVGIWNRRVKRWMVPVSYRELDKLRENWEIAHGEPYLFAPVNYRYIAIFPATSGVGVEEINKMYVIHKAQANTLTDDTEPNIPINVQDDILTHYSTMDMFEQAEEWTKAQAHFGHYMDKIEQLDKIIRRRDVERLGRLGGNI